MRLIRTGGPANSIVDDERLWDHLRVDTTGSPAAPVDATYIKMLRDAVTAYLDGASGVLGRALITQTWELHLDGFPHASESIRVPLPPLQSITSITYIDADGASQTLDASTYQVVEGGHWPSRVALAYDKSWPSTRNHVDVVTVAFVAGFGDDPADVPSAIGNAALLYIADLYDQRSAVNVGSIVNTLPAADMLLAPWRVWAFA